MTQEEATKKLADIIFNAAKSGYMPYDTNDEMCAMNIAKKHIDEFYTSFPPDLDEAAEKNFEAMEVLEHENIFEETHRKIFKAGAEWLAEQGIKLHGRILPGPKCNLYIESDCFDRGYKGLNYSFSDSNDVDMFIQIRKK